MYNIFSPKTRASILYYLSCVKSNLAIFHESNSLWILWTEFDAIQTNFKFSLELWMSYSRTYRWASVWFWSFGNEIWILWDRLWDFLNICCGILKNRPSAPITTHVMVLLPSLRLVQNPSLFNFLLLKTFLRLFSRSMYTNNPHCDTLSFIINEFAVNLQTLGIASLYFTWIFQITYIITSVEHFRLFYQILGHFRPFRALMD